MKASCLLGFAVLLACVWTPGLGEDQSQPEREPSSTEVVAKALDSLSQGTGQWTLFSVTYSDLHPLHGGIRMTIHGTGEVTQQVVREKAGKAKKVTDADLKKLVELLRKHSAWEQQEADRPAVPDESKAHLTVSYGEDSTSVWEWHKDLKSNQRLLDIREAMKNSAWESPP
jgi:hypothetical protein